jgi:hypothetical protein
MNKQTQQPMQASGISCKLWLVTRIPANIGFTLPENRLQSLDIENPLNGTVQGIPYPDVSGIMFDTSTPQVQSSNAQGQVTWRYRLNPSIQTNIGYDLVVLNDWEGKSYNWYWADIDITTANN